jgi:hypothetical protein
VATALQQIGAWFAFFGLMAGVGGCSVHVMDGGGEVTSVCGWIAVVVGAILFSCGALLAELRSRRD